MVINEKTDLNGGGVPLWANLAIPIKTLPNLRRVDPAGKLFRSSRQDLLSSADRARLSQLGIRSVIDFRSAKEYQFCSGEKLYDQNCNILEVIIPKQHQFLATENVPVRPVKGRNLQSVSSKESSSRSRGIFTRNRYLINFFKSNYIFAVFNRIPLYKRLFSLLYLIVDVIFCTNYLYFFRFFAREVLNPAGLLSNYIDMIELSGRQICLALRIISQPSNLPALLSCAHGKDRTGIVVAMVLSLLGKSDEYIVTEYALSEVGLDPIRSRVYKEIVEQRNIDTSFTHAKPETMEGLLRYINNKYGSVPNYLESIGFSRQEQENLIQALKE